MALFLAVKPSSGFQSGYTQILLRSWMWALNLDSFTTRTWLSVFKGIFPCRQRVNCFLTSRSIHRGNYAPFILLCYSSCIADLGTVVPCQTLCQEADCQAAPPPLTLNSRRLMLHPAMYQKCSESFRTLLNNIPGFWRKPASIIYGRSETFRTRLVPHVRPDVSSIRGNCLPQHKWGGCPPLCYRQSNVFGLPNPIVFNMRTGRGTI